MASPSIHPTAIVADTASLGEGVSIGPYCVVGPDVRLGDGVILHSHVVVEGHTTVGEKTVVYPFACLGHIPQDLKFGGEASRLVIGARNRIREHVTMHPGTQGGGMETVIGDDGLFMVGCHVAHDCRIGNHVILANNATLAGHVHVGDYAILGGLSAVHQFVRIGAHAMIGGMSGVDADVIPFGLVRGERATLHGLNLVGMERRGFSREDIGAARSAFSHIFSRNARDTGTFAQRIDEAESTFGSNALAASVIDFLRTKSRHGFCQPEDGPRNRDVSAA